MKYESLALRDCGDDDRQFCFEVKRAAFRCYVEPIWGWDDAFQAEFHRKDWEAQRPQIIVCDGRDIGTIEIVESDDGFHLGEFYLFPAWQKKGIGSYFLRLLIERADAAFRPAGLEVIKANPVRSLYERFGFEIIGETQTHYRMRRSPIRNAETK